MSPIGSVTYGVAKELARILKLLVGKSIHHINNSKEFADEIRNTKKRRGGMHNFISCNCTLYNNSSDTCIVIKVRLEQDTEPPSRTILSASNIIELLGFCLKNTYFLFQNQFFEQTKGTAMGSPVSPIVANIYLEAFEQRASILHWIPQGSGRGMLMTHFWFNNRYTRRSFSTHQYSGYFHPIHCRRS